MHTAQARRALGIGGIRGTGAALLALLACNFGPLTSTTLDSSQVSPSQMDLRITILDYGASGGVGATMLFLKGDAGSSSAIRSASRATACR
jgi:hypothetical protein